MLQVVKISGVKNNKAEIRMSVGYREVQSGWSACSVKRCSVTEMRWSRYEVSVTSSVFWFYAVL